MTRTARRRMDHRVLASLLWAFACVGCTGLIGDPEGDDVPSVGRRGAQPPTPREARCAGDVEEAGRAPVRRLTRSQYDRTVRDLLGDDSQPSRGFAVDESQGVFYSNARSPVGALIATQYMEAAERLAADAAERVTSLVPCDPAADGEETCIARVVDELGARAFRRPVRADERARLLALYELAREELALSHGGGVRVVLTAVLQSPAFLYHVEETDPVGAGATVAPLTSWALASKLSYFLWGTMPDAELAAAAAAGELATDAEVAGQVERMMGDPRAREGMRDFVAQWLGLEMLQSVSKDRALVADFDGLRGALREETEAFFEHVLWESDATLATFLTASFTVIGPDVALLYGDDIVGGVEPAVSGTRVELHPMRRAGVLTHPALLAATAHFDQTSPVHRGLLVRSRLLCQHTPPPPPDVVAVPPSPEPGVTTRERYAQHATDPYCESCHRLMDPIGLGFESYDPVGRWQNADQGEPIDATGELVMSDIDGSFDGAVELAHRLAESAQVAECTVHQMLVFGLGRELEDADACSAHRVSERFVESGGDLRELVRSLALSDSFRKRRVETIEECAP